MRPSQDELDDLESQLSNALAEWWEQVTGEDTYAHEWEQAAAAALALRPGMPQ